VSTAAADIFSGGVPQSFHPTGSSDV